MDQTMVSNSRHEYAMQCCDQATVLRMQRGAWMAANAGYRTPRYLTFKQALELDGNVRKGRHGYTVLFVKQLQVRDKDGDDGETKIVPMMRAYTVFNVDQCEGLPDRVLTLGSTNSIGISRMVKTFKL
jgi:antirestriction protein ArdC